MTKMFKYFYILHDTPLPTIIGQWMWYKCYWSYISIREVIYIIWYMYSFYV